MTFRRLSVLGTFFWVALAATVQANQAKQSQRAHQAQCLAPAVPSEGHVWIFVRVNTALRSLRYAATPDPLKHPGISGGAGLSENVAVDSCLAVQVPVGATALFVKARGPNVDRAPVCVQTVTRCRDMSAPCLLPLVQVSARQRVVVVATGSLSQSVLRARGVDAPPLPQMQAMDATQALDVVRDVPRGAVARLLSVESREDIAFWTPRGAPYTVIPAEESQILLASDWPSLRTQFAWFRSGDWLLGSDTSEAIDASIAVHCVSDTCVVREIHGDSPAGLIVDREVKRLGPMPTDLPVAVTSIAVVERELTTEVIELRRGTNQVVGRMVTTETSEGPRPRELPEVPLIPRRRPIEEGQHRQLPR